MGRVDEVAVIAARGRRIANKIDGVAAHLTAFGEVRALALAGEFDSAVNTIRRHRADLFGRPVPGLGHGQCAQRHHRDGPRKLPRHHTPDGADRRGVDLRVGGSMELPGPAAAVPIYRALGRAEPGAELVAELRTRFGRHVAVFGPQLRIAESWLAAAEGNVSGAIVLALTPPNRPRNPGSRRSKCSRCTTPSATATG